ncbi:unnamed protein product, partial [Cladocopium goreaui]
MTTLSAKDIVVTWDGEPSTWADYSRKVRLQWEKTEKWKRKLLGPELASRLSGRAWAVVPSLDHRLLQKKNGTKYLLQFLRDRLCRTAVPDAGAKLEELFIKMKRPAGMTMSEWANQVQESYRKVQRALVRARQDKLLDRLQRDPNLKLNHRVHREEDLHRELPHLHHHRLLRRRHHKIEEHNFLDKMTVVVEYFIQNKEDMIKYLKKILLNQDNKNGRMMNGVNGIANVEDFAWDELEVEEVHVLPDEILGWLLLRRANLSSANRLAVQSSVQNSLFFRDIENALRDQEEELLQADQHRLPHRKRTYWVEDQGVWGLLVSEDAVDDAATEIHWVGSHLPAEVYVPEYADEENEEAEEIHWSYDYDGWHGHVQDVYGVWFETDGFGTYWNEDDYSDLTP